MDSLKKELLVLVEKREEMTEIEETLPNKETLENRYGSEKRNYFKSQSIIFFFAK